MRREKKKKGQKSVIANALKEETKMAIENDKRGAPEQQPMTLRYIDRPECDEIFADSINALSFDGQSLRIELGVTRLDEKKADAPLTGRRYPACRLVLTPLAAVDLINKMQQVGAAMAQAGVVKATPSPAVRDKTIEAVK